MSTPSFAVRLPQGLGLPAPKDNPPVDVVISAALSQIVTKPGPIAGRKVAVIADAGSDLAGIAALTKTLNKLGTEVLVTAAVGATLKAGRRSPVVERTFATARSIEFDTVVIAAGTTVTNDIKLVVLLQEAFRHCKPLGAWGSGVKLLDVAAVDREAPGLLLGGEVDKTFGQNLVVALGLHRVWERADFVMASAVPPSTTPTKAAPGKHLASPSKPFEKAATKTRGAR